MNSLRLVIFLHVDGIPGVLEYSFRAERLAELVEEHLDDVLYHELIVHLASKLPAAFTAGDQEALDSCFLAALWSVFHHPRAPTFGASVARMLRAELTPHITWRFGGGRLAFGLGTGFVDLTDAQAALPIDQALCVERIFAEDRQH